MMENRKKDNKRIKRVICTAVLVLSLAGLVGIGFGVYRERERKERDTLRYKQLQEEIRKEREAKEKAKEEAEKNKASLAEQPPVDFQKLQEQNSDIYAWIHIPGTNIDYPVLQSADSDDYYLNHTVEHAEGRPGAIYTERANTKDFEDPNTIIYGHNMHSNGTMFFELHRFEEKEFFDEHRQFEIYTPEGILHYEIFAAYEYDDRHILHSFDFTDEKVFADYLDDIFSKDDKNAHIREDVEVTSKDRIVTLSTCMKGRANHRWIVQAVRRDGD